MCIDESQTNIEVRIQNALSFFYMGGRHAIRFKSSGSKLCGMVVEVAPCLRSSTRCHTSPLPCGLFTPIVAASTIDKGTYPSGEATLNRKNAAER